MDIHHDGELTISEEIERHFHALIYAAISESLTLQQVTEMLECSRGCDITDCDPFIVSRGDIEELANRWILHLSTIRTTIKHPLAESVGQVLLNWGVPSAIEHWARMEVSARVHDRLTLEITQMNQAIAALPCQPLNHRAAMLVDRRTESALIGQVRLGTEIVRFAYPASGRWTIQEMPVKTAEVLALVPLEDDPYHNAIKAGARVMCANDKAGWVYKTGYTSGSTVWVSGDETVIVGTEEWIG